MSEESLTFDGRDFGRLEGKVDGLVLSLNTFQKNIDLLSGRVSTIEVDTIAIKAEQAAFKVVTAIELAKANSRNSTYQVVIAVAAVIVAIVAMGITIFK